ncbi:MAG: IreB family regulatory phosphoprotein [Culicoidibacterales bacterium]
MMSIDLTQKYNFDELRSQEVRYILEQVFAALKDKGYNPVNQVVGYLLSGDPAYIPRHQDARNLIRKLNRDEIIEELLKNYLGE